MLILIYNEFNGINLLKLLVNIFVVNDELFCCVGRNELIIFIVRFLIFLFLNFLLVVGFFFF